MIKKYTRKTFIYTAVAAGAALILIPMAAAVASSFKTQNEIMHSFFSLPGKLNLSNYQQILSRSDYYYALRNTVMITAVCLILNYLLIPMASYPIARRMKHEGFFKFLYIFMVSGIFVPFQVRMLPLIKLMNEIDMANDLGLILVYVSSAVCEGVFLYCGYLVNIPTDMEEAASIDGASVVQTYVKIMLPLMKPMTATLIIKNGLWYWNDYLLPSMMLKTAKTRTLTLFQYNFKTEYLTNYPLIFAAFVLSLIPIMIFYVVMQRRIMDGMTAGAVKG